MTSDSWFCNLHFFIMYPTIRNTLSMCHYVVVSLSRYPHRGLIITNIIEYINTFHVLCAIYYFYFLIKLYRYIILIACRCCRVLYAIYFLKSSAFIMNYEVSTCLTLFHINISYLKTAITLRLDIILMKSYFVFNLLSWSYLLLYLGYNKPKIVDVFKCQFW